MSASFKSFYTYIPEIKIPADFEEFWITGLHKDLNEEPKLKLKQIEYPLKQVEVFEATLNAGDGLALKGWYIRPQGNSNLPGLVRFHGYSGNRGQIAELLFWALQGYAILGMDVRGQCGETPDSRSYSQGQFAGWMTKGINNKQDYYWRQVYLDAARIGIALGKQTEVDENKLGVFGKSQGGGLALIAAALLNKGLNLQVKAISASIPFLCDFRLAYAQAQDGPLIELSQYFRLFDPVHKTFEQVLHTLSYFDCINFASWIDAPVLISVGLKDNVCPPQSVFGVYNLISSKKEIAVYPDYGHETIDAFVEQQLKFLAKELLD